MIQLFVSYWISAPLAKYISTIIFYHSVSPFIANSVIDMTSIVLIQPINYFIVFPIMYKIQTNIKNRLEFKPEDLESKYSLEPNYTEYKKIINIDEYEII